MISTYLKLGAAAVVLIAVAFVYHHIYESGVSTEVAKVQKASAAATAALEAKIAAAEHAHDQELADLTAYRDAHPEQSVRVCIRTPTTVRPTATVARRPSAPAGDIQPVSAGDSGGGGETAGPDIGGLLELLAARGDQLSAQLRARQAIDP